MTTFRTKNYIFARSDEDGYPGQHEEEDLRLQTQSTEPPTIENLITSIDGVLEYLVPVAALVAVVFIIIGGYMWMTSAGNPDRVKQAQGTLTWAVIGLIFVLLTGLLVRGLLEYVIGM